MGYRRKILAARRISKRRRKLIKSEDYSAVKRQCFRKVAYASERKVITKIEEVALLGRISLRYYQCPYCDLWHISSHKIQGQEFIS